MREQLPVTPGSGPRPARKGFQPVIVGADARDCGRPVTYRVTVRDGSPVEFTVDAAAGPLPTRTRCFEAIMGRSQPCPGCPALALARTPGLKRDSSVIPSNGGYRLAVAEPLAEDGPYLVHSVPLGDPVVSKLQRLRVDRIAAQAGLSRREMAVLELLLLGRSSGVIASALGITERTVRFHISNVLTKLEADSRADLLRLLL